MAAKRQTRRQTTTSTRSRKQVDAKPSRSHTWNEVTAIILMGTGLLLFLALISYSHQDLPSWANISGDASPDTTVSNFIGPAGALIAGYSYFFFGPACFLIPACLVWFGISTLLRQRVFTLANLGALATLLVSGACLADLQAIFFSDWANKYNIPSSGGVIGYSLGNYILLNTIGRVGAFILMSLVYVVSLIVITGLHPFQFMRMAKQAAKNCWTERRARNALQAGQSAPAPSPKARKATTLAISEPPEEAEEFPEELPLREIPEPKIFDSSVRETNPGNSKKPSLADLMHDRRKGRSPHLSPQSMRFKDYTLPEMDLLESFDAKNATPANKSQLLATQRTIIETLATFGIEVTPGDITRGPTITRYEIYPGTGLRVNRITSLEADIARATKAERISIIAPIPGKDTVGVEIANTKKITVRLRELLEDPAFCDKNLKIPLALGKDVYGKTIIGDLAQMPHLLIAGATGSGKSVCINSVIASMLYRFTPDELRFILIDPKVVEMQLYNALPHLVVPVVTDPKKVLLALRWVVNEMERRYRIFASADVRDFDSFNSRNEKKAWKSARRGKDEEKDKAAEAKEKGELLVHAVSIDPVKPGDASGAPAGDLEEEEEIPDRIPYIVVIIDELADLMLTAPVDVESAIQRLAQKARAAGIHLILATQTPRKEVITGNIKTNIPTRIAFQVPSKIDSRVILDTGGADRLVGQGDMLFMPPGTSTLLRAQGALITDDEIHRVVDACSSQGEPAFESSIQETLDSATGEETDVSPEDEEIVEKCIEVIQQEKRASTSLLQRRLRLGYTRAARMIDILEERGIIGPGDGAKPREILVDLTEALD